MFNIKTFDATEKIISRMSQYKQAMDDIDFIIVQVPTRAGDRKILKWKEISVSDFFKAAKVTGSTPWSAVDFRIIFKNHDFIRTVHGIGPDFKLDIEYIPTPKRVRITDSVTLSSLVFPHN